VFWLVKIQRVGHIVGGEFRAVVELDAMTLIDSEWCHTDKA
jgi:hypothetical protein